ncbi:MAG: hypothetical protein IT374_27825 [Polyangiaceae bacterium]|nr:hypothetical protein [Polyangiaceae bacterium]
MTELVLTGLDGANPLGFLAALGVLEALSENHSGARLAWRDEGVWRPVVSGVAMDREALVAFLDADRQAVASDPALALQYGGGVRDLKPPPAEYRAYLEGLVAAARVDSRRSVDWANAFATDVAVDNNGATKPTALHFTAGRQLWLEMVNKLVAEVTAADLHEGLWGPWIYTRELPVMAWDATAARDYALRASNPSTDKKAGVPGADWLAVRGMPAIAVAPRGARILTTGCSGEWKTGRFTWPLWGGPLGRALVRSVVRTPQLSSLGAREREARGITCVFQSGIRRTDQGGYGSFSPASVV